MSYSVVQQKLTQHCKSTMRAYVLSRFSRVQLFATPWTVAHQAPLSTRSSRQEYWSGLSCPSSGDLPNPGIKPGSPTWLVNSLPSEPAGKPILGLYGSLKSGPHSHCHFLTLGISPGIPLSQTLRPCAVISRDWA